MQYFSFKFFTSDDHHLQDKKSTTSCSISGMYHHTNGPNILAKDINMFKGDEITVEAYTMTQYQTPLIEMLFLL